MLSKNLKSVATAGVMAVAAMVCACSHSGSRTVDMPVITYANTTITDIVKVELTDSNTVLHINAYFRPNNWIRIAGDTHLMADGRKYAMTGTEGIEPDTEFWMPESGEADFRLIFEPLPFSTEKFDFIEGDAPGAFRLWDVDLTGKKQPTYPEGFPKELQKAPADGPVPDMAFEIGETTVNLHVMPYKPELFGSMNLYVNKPDGTQQEYVVKLDSLGNGSVSFDQYGTASAFLTANDYVYGHYTFYPGETADCYIDARRSGNLAMSHRKDFDAPSYRTSAHTGHYSNLDRNMALHTEGTYGLNLYNGTFADYHMSGQEYKAMVKALYDEYSDSLAKMNDPQMVKEMKMLYLQDDVLEAIGRMRFFLEHNYRHAHDAWRERNLPADSIPGTLTDEDYADVLTWFDVANPKLLLAGNAIGKFNWNDKGADGDLSKSLMLFSEITAKANSQLMTEENIDTLRTLSNPFFAAACDSINRRNARKIATLQGKADITPTPDVPSDKVFDAIIAPHKGKVVIVDLWNTWCGPCRSAIAACEPMKDSELSDDDIVWIYIADESSDQVKYLTMIPDIRGIHYKVSDDQIASIRNRFNVDGIPYYILVDRNGKAEGRPDLRDHSKYIEAIKSKL